MRKISVADPVCLGSRISDPTTAPKEEAGRGEIFFALPLFVAANFVKIVNNFIFEKGKEIYLAKTLRITVPTFYPKFCHLAMKNLGLESEIRDPEKIYS